MLIRTQVQLTKEQLKTLRRLASEQNVSISALIRQAVDIVIQSPKIISAAEQRQRAIEAAGRFRSQDGAVNISEEHDKYLNEAYQS
jgi:hypothetical protein